MRRQYHQTETFDQLAPKKWRLHDVVRKLDEIARSDSRAPEPHIDEGPTLTLLVPFNDSRPSFGGRVFEVRERADGERVIEVPVSGGAAACFLRAGYRQVAPESPAGCHAEAEGRIESDAVDLDAAALQRFLMYRAAGGFFQSCAQQHADAIGRGAEHAHLVAEANRLADEMIADPTAPPVPDTAAPITPDAATPDTVLPTSNNELHSLAEGGGRIRPIKALVKRPPRLKPFWPKARDEARQWLDQNGIFEHGDGGQSKLVDHIETWLELDRGHKAGRTSIANHVREWVEEFKREIGITN